MTLAQATVTDDDTAVFERLLQDNHARLVRIARQFAPGDAWQDLLQEMRLQLWRSLDSFRGQAQVATWVYRIAMNTAISHQRRQPPSTAHDHAIDPDTRAGGHGADAALGLLREFLAALDPVNRALLIMDLDGLEREQIAQVLGLSVNAIAVRMTRLRQTFEQRYLEHA